MLTKLSDYTKTNIILDKAINVEGGYVDNPSDSGGPTKYGVTLATATKYRNYLTTQFKWDGDMRHLTVPMALYVYDQDEWEPMGLDGVMKQSPLLADLLFEAGINFGHEVVAKWFQTCLNVLNNEEQYTKDILVDGDVGPKTISALQDILNSRPRDGMKNLLFMISAQASAYYVTLAVKYPKNEVFESGWENRARLQYNVYIGILGLT